MAVQNADCQPALGGGEPGAGEPVGQTHAKLPLHQWCRGLVSLSDASLRGGQAEISLQSLLHGCTGRGRIGTGYGSGLYGDG